MGWTGRSRTGPRPTGTASWMAGAESTSSPWPAARRTKEDFAHQMRWLVDEAYPEVQVVRVVLDNLNTQRKALLYEAFPAGEARRIAKRLGFHHTPKHGSWLNPVLSLPKGWRR